VAVFAGTVKVLGTGRGGKAKEEDYRGAALAEFTGRRSRKGKALGFKATRVLPG
jgi:topoisomerase-4 subunit A